MQKVKIIFHIDMNAFFCSVEEIINPFLKNKAFAIGNEKSNRGVISTASYEARKLGIHSALSVVKAKQICPNLIFIDGHYDLYSHYSKLFLDLLLEYTDRVLMASIDEAYMDVTSIKDIHPLDLAKEIQDRLLEEYELPCSIGIAPTLFLAKMASDMKKPLGITVLRKRDIEEKLYPLDIKEMFGIGKKTYPLLKEIKINTIKDFVDNYDKIITNELFSKKSMEKLYLCAIGKSSDVVDPMKYVEPQSIGISSTLNIDTDNELILKQEIKSLSKELYKRLKQSKKKGKTISIIIKYSNFKTVQKSKTLEKFILDESIIFDYAYDLFLEHWNLNEVRLVGITISNFLDESNKDYDLFTMPIISNKEEAVEKVLRKLKEDLGENIISLGIRKTKKN